MGRLSQLWERLSYYRRRDEFDTYLDEEMRFHMEMKARENIAAGMLPDEAERAARRQFGNQTLLTEVSREMWSFRSIETLLQDLRFGLRVLLKHPGFTLVALLSLALGVGANTAIFSVIYGVLVDPYPYARPHDIWATQVVTVNQNQGRGAMRITEFQEMAKLPMMTDLMATGFQNVLLTGDGRAPESVQGITLTGNAFKFLGVPPVMGRTIEPSDIGPGGEPEPVVVLSYKAWFRMFDGSPSAIGKTLTLNDKPHTVIGVMPSRFGWFGSDGFWLPMPMNPASDNQHAVIFRLQSGVTREMAAQQLQALFTRLAQERPERFPKDGFQTRVTNYMDMTVASGEMRSSLLLLFGTVGFLLLIACANVANLQLARATARAREIALRAAIGASRVRILRQLLTESVLLSFAGGILGVLFALAATRAIVAFMPDFYVPNESRITVNYWVLLFTAAIAVLTGVISGIVPALRASRPDLTVSLKDSTKGSGASRSGARIRNLLVITEVALAVILLVGASLMIRSFMVLNQIPLGFNPDRVLIMAVPLPSKRYPTMEQRLAFFRNLEDRVRSLPGVEALSIGNGGTPYTGRQTTYTIEGKPKPEGQRIAVTIMGAGYLDAMGIPLKRGRAINEQEVALADRVALINEAAAKLWGQGEDPLGRTIRLDFLEKPPPDVFTPVAGNGAVTIVGVIGDTKNAGMDKESFPSVYVPNTLIVPAQRMLVVRTTSDPRLMVNAVKEQVKAIDKDQPVARSGTEPGMVPGTMDEMVGMQFQQPRFNMALFTLFAALGLALTLAGIYSVLSYHVSQKTHEIGLRMALGADKKTVLKLMLSIGAKLVGTGLAIGLIVSLILARFMRSILFQVTSTDPFSIVGVVVVLSIAAFLACYLPAMRAARLDPWIALRHD